MVVQKLSRIKNGNNKIVQNANNWKSNIIYCFTSTDIDN